MKILVLDTRSGDRCSDLFVGDFDRGIYRQVPLGYVPEVRYDAAADEVVLVETELSDEAGRQRSYWLKCYDTDTWRPTRAQQIPERPMYAGFPGRSTRIAPTPSGRYLYFLQSEMLIRFPEADDVFRLTVHRYDRHRHALEMGGPAVESCMLDFGRLGSGDDEFFFHLSCDYPSTLAFGTFPAKELEWVRLEQVPPRTHCPQETCGSWMDERTGLLYCTTGEGKIYRVARPPGPAGLFSQHPMKGDRSVPLHQVYGAGDTLFVGVASDPGERSLGLISEIWQVSLKDGSVLRQIPLPVPLMCFVATPEGDRLVATCPYQRSLFVLDARSGRVLQVIRDVGISPCEVLLIP